VHEGGGCEGGEGRGAESGELDCWHGGGFWGRNSDAEDGVILGDRNVCDELGTLCVGEMVVVAMLAVGFKEEGDRRLSVICTDYIALMFRERRVIYGERIIPVTVFSRGIERLLIADVAV